MDNKPDRNWNNNNTSSGPAAHTSSCYPAGELVWPAVALNYIEPCLCQSAAPEPPELFQPGVDLNIAVITGPETPCCCM